MNERAHTDAYPIDSRAVESKSVSADLTPTAARRVPPSIDVLPRAFGRYELRRLLGRGGMGAVYLAHDPQLDRLVALKMPTPVAIEGWRERFVAEARAAATLTHPNVCPVFDVGEVDGQPYLTMAYIEGETLAAKIARERLDPDEAVELVATVARAMQEAHRRGIVHRDLKPANLMLDPAARPVVMDFGLALRSTAADDLRLTLTGVAMGTPAYMPPEQAGGDTDAIGPPADVYALGVMLYELLTGRVPFKGKSFGQLLAQIERDPPPPPSSFNENVEPALEAIILTCLAKRPADRFASAGELADALDRFLDGDDRALLAEYRRPFEVPGPTGEFVPAASGSAAVPRKSRRGLWVAVAAALLFAGAAAGAVIYVQTDYGELEIRLSDPKAQVDVKVNGKEVELKTGSDGRVTRIKVGKNQKLEVSGPDFETVAESFDIKRGGVTIVHVQLKQSEVAKKPDPKPVDPNAAKKPPGPDPPVPAVPPKLKPPPYPKESTLIEVPGWQILADATRAEMEAWLDARKKDRHTVAWLDCAAVGEKSVFCAAAALDDREPNWTVRWDVPADGADIARLRKVIDTESHFLVSGAVEVSGNDTKAVLLWWPGKRRWGITLDSTDSTVDDVEKQQKLSGGAARLLRPYPMGDAFRWVAYLERSPTFRSTNRRAIPADEFGAFLAQARKDEQHPLTVVGYVRDGRPTFAAVVGPNTGRLEWEAAEGLTAAQLKAKSEELAKRNFRPACVTAFPFDGAVRYCAVWVKDPPKPPVYPKEPTPIEAAGWQVLADASKEEMQKWLDARKKDKHSVTWLDATGVGDKPLFVAVAALDDRASDWRATLDMPSRPFPEQLAKRFDVKNSHFVSLCRYVQDEDVRVALLMHPKPTGWFANPDADRLYFAQLEPQIEKNGHGYRVFRPGPGGRGAAVFAIVTEPMTGGGEKRFDMTEGELTKFVATVRAGNDRLASLTAYPNDGQLAFAATTGTNKAKAEWSAEVNLTAGQLKARTEEQTKKGFRPESVTACAWDGAVRYCVVWVKESPKEKEPAKKP